MMKLRVYADNAATTPLTAGVFRAMEPWLRVGYGNPSALYSLGKAARTAVEDARAQISGALGAQPEEIYFTSGGTEADNWALKGMLLTLSYQGKNHLIISSVEHHAIGRTTDFLEQNGMAVTRLPVNRYGLVDPAAVEQALTPQTALVSVMTANNEIGTIQPIPSIGRICKKHNVFLHTDAVQAAGHLELDVDFLGVDLLSLSAHKFHGPKGVGALYVRDGIPFPAPLLHGGGQEFSRRAGTENVAGIVGMGAAFTESLQNLSRKNTYLSTLRDRLIRGLTQIPDSRLCGHPQRRLPGNIYIAFAGINSSELLLLLRQAGVAASSGSACSSGEQTASHVLTAIGLDERYLYGGLRLTLGTQNTPEDISYLLQSVPIAVRRLRKASAGRSTVL